MEDRLQQLDTNSFFVSGIGDLPESKLCELLQCSRVKVHSWELTGEKRRFCEAFYSSPQHAEQVYNHPSQIKHEKLILRPLAKHAMTTIWVSGLPGVVYSRDLFTGLSELTVGLMRVTIPPNPEVPGIASLGVAILTYSSHVLAEEALHVFKTPTRLYNQNYRVFVNRDIQAMWAEPFYDLLTALSKESRYVLITNLSPNVSMRQIEEEVSCFGNIEKLRRYATWAVVAMRTVAEGKNLVRSGGLLVDGKKWKVKPAARINEDPAEPDLFRNHILKTAKSSSSTFGSNDIFYELSVLQLSTADRQRLYEVIQSAPAFPCTRDSNVKGLSVDLVNKARKLLQQSRRPDTNDYLLGPDNKPSGYDPSKKQKVEPKYNERPHDNLRYQSSQNTPHSPRVIDQKYSSEPPAYLPYSPSPIIAHGDRGVTHTPEQIQNLTMDQKIQYYYYLNNPGPYYNPYNNYGP